MKRLDYTNIDEVRPFLSRYGYNEFNCNIVTLMMWQEVYPFYYEIKEHYMVAYWYFDHHFHWMMPMCDDQYLDEALSYMITYSNTHNQEFMMVAVVEDFLKRIKSSQYSFIHRFEVDAGDYIYDASMHRSLTGKKMQKRRNHYNAFVKGYRQRYEYRPYHSSMYGKVMSFLENWQAHHDHKEDIAYEIRGIDDLLIHHNELSLMIGCCFIDHKIEGLIIASYLTPETVQIHVEKANREIRGIYVALLKSFLEEHLEAKYINREDDLGIESLRKAKRDLHPLEKLKKYTVYLDKTMISKATAKDFDQIKNLWLNCFEDETRNSTDFYFDHLYDPKNTYILKKGDTVLSVLQAKPMQLYMQNQIIPTHFIVGVCTETNYRHNGFMKRLMERTLEDLKDDPMIILQAYNWNLYLPFGFENYYYHHLILITMEHQKGDKTNCHLDFHFKEDQLLDSYNQYIQETLGARVRDINYYRDYFIPYHQNENHKIALVKVDEKIIGYLVYEDASENIIILEHTINERYIREIFSRFNKPILLRTKYLFDPEKEDYKVKNMAIRFQDKHLKELFKQGIPYINEIL